MDAILFDFDGVLVDSEPIHYQCWVEILRPFGFRMDWATYRDTCIGISDRLMIERFANSQTPALNADELYAQYPAKKELFRARIMEANAIPAETIALVKEVKLPMAVVSSSGRNEVEPAIVQAGIRPNFAAMVCGLEAGQLKPAPDPYLKAAELLGAKRPLVVEDSDAGEQSGRAAGFEVLRIERADELARAVRERLGRI